MSACTDCGGDVGPAGYCERCGLRAPDPTTPTVSSRRRTSSPGSSRGPRGPGERVIDPEERLLPDPALPERRRRCRNPRCRKRVGQSGRRGPGRPVGFCRECGWGYSFRPPLQPDGTHRVVVADRYEVLGAIGRGGLGWVYLAHDVKIARHVVLKGLLDPEDPRTRHIALDELRALAEADHPNIVAVHDVVRHSHRLPPRPGGEVVIEHIDYIVMEYVHGESLLERYRTRRLENAHLTISEAAEHLLPAMAAVAHLHRRGLAHNDLKPDNVMVAESGRVYVVDLGAVSAMGGDPGYGTVGYRDPAGHPPSAQTDVYALGRSLAALTIPVPDLADERPLPGPEQVPLLGAHESFHLLLARATDPDPRRRFACVEDLADQLRAVVREVESLDGTPRPGLSDVFGPEVRVIGTAGFPRLPAERARWALALPDAQLDPTDPHARRLTTVQADPQELLALVAALPVPTWETRLQAARARVELLAGDGDEVDATVVDAAVVDAELRAMQDEEPDDVRALWLRGIAALVLGDVEVADTHVAEVRRKVPGEAAPQLARAVCAELRGDTAAARDFYRTVWRTDRSYVSAAFGLARAELAAGDRTAAITVLGEVPAASRYATAATLGALAAADPAAHPDHAPGFFTRAARLDEQHPERLAVDDHTRQEAVLAALRTALLWVHSGRPWPRGDRPTHLLGVALEVRDLRTGLEHAYRRMAGRTRDRAARTALVDRANRERNWSIW